MWGGGLEPWGYYKAGDPEILNNFLNTSVLFIKVYIFGMEWVEGSIKLISNFTKNTDFLRKWQQNEQITKHF